MSLASGGEGRAYQRWQAYNALTKLPTSHLALYFFTGTWQGHKLDWQSKSNQIHKQPVRRVGLFFPTVLSNV